MVCYSQYFSPLGTILLCADDRGLTGLWFEGQAHCPQGPLQGNTVETAALRDARRWLDIYFSGQEPDFTPPLNPSGTAFQTAVWDILLAIPYGQTVAYGEIAQILAHQRGIPRMSAQAVGSAVGRNPISLIIPCHRVVGAGGELTGYAGGIQRKKALLDLEKNGK